MDNIEYKKICNKKERYEWLVKEIDKLKNFIKTHNYHIEGGLFDLNCFKIEIFGLDNVYNVALLGHRDREDKFERSIVDSIINLLKRNLHNLEKELEEL